MSLNRRSVKTLKVPKQHFLARVLEALDMSEYGAPGKLGIDVYELQALLRKGRGDTLPVGEAETWERIYAYVTERMGLLLAVREELQRKLRADRLRRAAQRAEVTDR